MASLNFSEQSWDLPWVNEPRMLHRWELGVCDVQGFQLQLWGQNLEENSSWHLDITSIEGKFHSRPREFKHKERILGDYHFLKHDFFHLRWISESLTVGFYVSLMSETELISSIDILEVVIYSFEFQHHVLMVFTQRVNEQGRLDAECRSTQLHSVVLPHGV